MSELTIAAGGVRALMELAVSKGANRCALAERSQIDPADLEDRDNRILYELYALHWTGSRWEAGSGAIFPLDSNARRPDGWTSADAAGLAILPGLLRYDEVYGSDPIRHAFRVTVRATNGYVFPACLGIAG